jgi:hypothetical protein
MSWIRNTGLNFCFLCGRTLCLGDQELYPVRPDPNGHQSLRGFQRGTQAVQAGTSITQQYCDFKNQI